jgi:hypothetical protein
MAADAKAVFEVATIKPSVPDRPGRLFTVRGRQVLTVNTCAVVGGIVGATIIAQIPGIGATTTLP